jgi:hypothetical protein
MAASTENIDLSFTYDGADVVRVVVSGFDRGITAVRALASAGQDPTRNEVAASFRAGSRTTNRDVVIDFEEDDDRATVTVSGVTTPRRVDAALRDAGSESTFVHVVSALADRGDASLLELMS